MDVTTLKRLLGNLDKKDLPSISHMLGSEAIIFVLWQLRKWDM